MHSILIFLLPQMLKCAFSFEHPKCYLLFPFWQILADANIVNMYKMLA